MQILACRNDYYSLIVLIYNLLFVFFYFDKHMHFIYI